MFRKYLAEFLGTCTLVAVVVGSGTMATQMSPDQGVELLINTISTVFALGRNDFEPQQQPHGRLGFVLAHAPYSTADCAHVSLAKGSPPIS